MDELSILLIEDNRSFAQEVESQLTVLGYRNLRSVATLADAEAAIRAYRPDLLLVNVALAANDGSWSAGELRSPPRIPILYLTHSPNESASNTSAPLYLAEPLRGATLQRSIDTALRQLTPTDTNIETGGSGALLRDRIYVKKNNRLERILISDILWVRADGNYCFVQVGEKRFVIKISLRKLLAVLPDHLFTQIQKSFAVHLARVEAIDLNTNNVIIEGHSLPMGRSYRDEIISRINLIK